MAIGAGGGDAQARHHYPPAIGLDYIPVGYGSGPGGVGGGGGGSVP
jgi:hypothetical protein